MFNAIHVYGSYLFILVFLVACGLSLLSLLRKRPELERVIAMVFVAAFGVLVIAYACGFGPKAELLTAASEPVARLAHRHHDMAKFVLTGMSLIAAAALTVLIRYRGQRFPVWFLPNLLFLALMIATFSVRSLVYAYQLDTHPARHQPLLPKN